MRLGPAMLALIGFIIFFILFFAASIIMYNINNEISDAAEQQGVAGDVNPLLDGFVNNFRIFFAGGFIVCALAFVILLIIEPKDPYEEWRG